MTTIRPLRSRAALLAAALSMTAALAACSSGSAGDADGGAASDASSEVAASGGDAAPDDVPAPGAGSPAAGLKAEDAASDSSGSSAASGPQTAAMERSVISTGAVSLTSKDVATARQDVQRVVDAQGGDITDEDTETDDDGTASYARLVVRVPSAKFGATMEALEQVATLVSSSRGSDDVTTEVIDTGVRVRAQEASLKRVELLLADARDLKDVIWIESQLTSRQAELDSLKSQQAYLRDQTSLSTITVDVSTPAATSTEQPEERPAGFLVGLRGGLGALGATAVTVATVLGALLPFAVLVGVVGGPLWLVLRRRRAAAPSAPAAPPAA